MTFVQVAVGKPPAAGTHVPLAGRLAPATIAFGGTQAELGPGQRSLRDQSFSLIGQKPVAPEEGDWRTPSERGLRQSTFFRGFLAYWPINSKRLRKPALGRSPRQLGTSYRGVRPCRRCPAGGRAPYGASQGDACPRHRAQRDGPHLQQPHPQHLLKSSSHHNIMHKYRAVSVMIILSISFHFNRNPSS